MSNAQTDRGALRWARRLLLNVSVWSFVTTITLAVIGFIADSFMWNAREAKRRVACTNNAKVIVAALHNYHDDFDAFPPAWTTNEAGVRLHSWRVLILPYLGHDELYVECRLDEPWNSPHNRRLLSRIPDCYRCPGHKHHGNSTDDFVTNYVGIVGWDAALRPEQSASISELVNGLQAEILIVEVNEHSVPWMAPNDLSTLEAVELLASASESNHGTGIIVGLATGSVDMVYKPNHSAGVDEWLVRHSGIGSGEEESIVITE